MHATDTLRTIDDAVALHRQIGELEIHVDKAARKERLPSQTRRIDKGASSIQHQLGDRTASTRLLFDLLWCEKPSLRGPK